jgi:drug/metabolite transporter (DMT)-like permease
VWIFLALLSRFLWAGCNAIDQVLSRAHRDQKTAAVTALELAMDLPVALVALAMGDRHGLGAQTPAFFVWIAAAVVAQCFALVPYYKSMQEEEARDVVPYFALVPVFLTALAALVRHESFGPLRMAGAGLIVLCGFLFSWDFKRGALRPRALGLMAVSSFFYACVQFAMREAGEMADGWTVAGYVLLGSAFAGFALLAKPPVRRAVMEAARETRGATLLLALAGNTLTLLGDVALLAAFARAPTTGHVASLAGAQPFFLFFFTAALNRLFPRHYEKVALGREIRIKLLLLLGTLAGVWILARA